MAQYVHPYPEVMANRNQTPVIRRGVYDATLTGNFPYVAGDLVQLNAGKPRKLALAANGAFTGTSDSIYLVGQPWQMNAKNLHSTAELDVLKARGVPMDVIGTEDEFVLTLESAAGTPVTTPANQAAIDALLALVGTQRDIAWSNAEGVVTVLTSAPTAARVVIQEIYATIGDANPRAKVKFLSAFLGA
jgi:hypothetical protein